jgi:hypothetical protein
MVVVALACLLFGCLRHGFAWKSVLTATSCLVMGIGFVAIGLLELEWLERVIGFADGLFSGLVQWFWFSWRGSWSESEWAGRHRARGYWVAIGVLVFLGGCLSGSRVLDF